MARSSNSLWSDKETRSTLHTSLETFGAWLTDISVATGKNDGWPVFQVEGVDANDAMEGKGWLFRWWGVAFVHPEMLCVCIISIAIAVIASCVSVN